MRATSVGAVLMAVFVAGCRPPEPPPREYQLRGQVLAVNPAANQVIIRHEDIKGFMPAMTMPFKVRDRGLLDGLVAGDLVSATLVVREDEAYLSALRRTGHGEVAPGPPPPVPPELYRTGERVPDATFVDQDGQRLPLASLRGRGVALTFIYTRCPLPQFCPLMDRQFAALQKAVAADRRLSGRVRLLSISFDPDYDTPAVLKAHAAHVGADRAVWTYATAERAVIEPFAAGFGLTVMREGDGPGEIVHNLRTAVLDPTGRLTAVFSGSDWTADQVLAALAEAVAARRH